MKPSSLAKKVPTPLAEVPPWPPLDRMVAFSASGTANSYLRCYRLGECPVVVTREGGLFHLSISHPGRYPTWEEISEAWYRTVPGAGERTGALILPPLEEYINVVRTCMQVVEVP